jgi:diguanylate cyclase (GGDEF)-like protein
VSQFRPAWIGKITRRLFLIFLLFALIPTSVLTLLALRYISEAATDQINRTLDDEAGVLVDQVFTRLSFLADRLALRAGQVAAGGEGERPELRDLSAEGVELLFGEIDLQRLDEAGGLRSTESAIARLQEGGSILLRLSISGGRQSSYIARAIDRDNLQDGLATVRIDTDHILGAPDDRDMSLDSCVYNDAGVVLFGSNLPLCEVFAGLGRQGGGYRGLANRNFNGVDYHAGYRNVFLGSLYAAEDWRVNVIRPSAQMFSASENFKKLFFAVATLVVLTISFASVFLIRRQMSPLSSIMAGIERVSRKDYSQSVDIKSGDEFEDLADAFNTMSGRVSHQLVTLASMSEIDQMILSRVKKEDIIQIVLQKTLDVLPGDHIAVMLLDNGGGEGFLYRLADGAPDELLSEPVHISEQEKSAAMESAEPRLCTVGELPAGLNSKHMPTATVCQLLPIRMNDKLVAMILLGFDEAPRLDPEDIGLALNYADRIAVALANAEWEQRLFRQAHYDSLTGLPNRLAFLDRLSQDITHARREDLTFGVLFIDLDNFKLVNDSLGHPVGDEFIKIMAERFSACLRADDIVSRLGGDEFVVTATGSSSHSVSVTSISRVANRILEAASKPVSIQGHDIRASASVGIAIYPRDGETPEELVKNADTAMYHAKSEGKGKFQFYARELNEQLTQLMHLSSDLRRALEQDQFELHYQPKVDANTGQVLGAEALVRWQHPERGMIRPDDFIGAAEVLGLISAIGDWTLEAACAHLQAWQSMGLQPVRIAVNISASQLQQDDMYAKLRRLLDAYSIEGKYLELEITENMLLQDMKTTVAALERVRTLGVHVAIDDYGTGFSSLSYMKELPVDTLKIDRCFITDICTEYTDQAIVHSTIVLARNLKMKVLAEGVETIEQLAMLQAYGCEEIQGYLFSKPMPEDEFLTLLREGTRYPV